MLELFKKKWIFILLFFLGLFPLGIFAQDLSHINMPSASTKRIMINFGQVYHLKLDHTYSRLPKKGFNNRLDIGYENQTQKAIFDTQGSFMIGQLHTEGNDLNIVNNYGGNIRAKYLRNLNRFSTDKLSIFLGMGVNLRGEIWFPDISMLRYGWDINLGAELNASVRYKATEKLILQYDFDVPMFGVLWRSHNNGQQLITEETQLEKGFVASAFETPRFSYIFDAFYIDNTFRMHYALSEKMSFFYNFSLSYRHIMLPLIKKGYEINNALGIAYKF